MPSRTRRYLLATAILVTVLTAFGMELGELHWKLCFTGYASAMPSLPVRAGLAVLALLTELSGLLVQLGAGLPYVLIIALARGRLMATIALVPLLFGLLVVADPAGLHSCDQKGCDVCAQVLIWQFSILMPLGFIVLAAMLAPRLIRAVLRPSPPKG